MENRIAKRLLDHTSEKERKSEKVSARESKCPVTTSGTVKRPEDGTVDITVGLWRFQLQDETVDM